MPKFSHKQRRHSRNPEIGTDFWVEELQQAARICSAAIASGEIIIGGYNDDDGEGDIDETLADNEEFMSSEAPSE